MISPSAVTTKLAELRHTFDQARAAPFSSEKEEQSVSLLAIRISRDPFAIKVNEIGGLVAGRKIVPVPSPVPELLGLAGIRGALIPVYSLEALLGYGAQTEQTRWLALCGEEDSFALAFGEFEGYLRIPPHQLFPINEKDTLRVHVKEIARTTGFVRAVVSISLLKETIQGRCRSSSVSKER